MAAEHYQRRAVAFLDILGFSQLVERADELEWRNAIESVLKTLRGTLAPNAAFDLRLSQFSDCIVISAPVEPYSVQLVMTGSIMLANNLLQHMVLLRGGIAIGNLIHTDDVMFGPGMLTAYRSDASGGPPRISIDETLSSEIASWHNDFGLEALMRTDSYDLTLALHTLHDYHVYTPEPGAGKVVLDEAAAKLSKQIAWQCYGAGHSAPVRAKWLWMERYWNEVVGANNVLPSTTHFASEFLAAKK